MKSDTRQLVVINDNVVEEAKLIIEALPFDPPYTIVIKPHKASRSRDQDALYYEWCNQIAEQSGSTKDGVHKEMKQKHLTKIFAREFDDYAQMVEDIRDNWREGKADRAKRMYAQWVKQTSITRCSVAMMREYMEQVKRDAQEMGFRLIVKNEYRYLKI